MLIVLIHTYLRIPSPYGRGRFPVEYSLVHRGAYEMGTSGSEEGQKQLRLEAIL